MIVLLKIGSTGNILDKNCLKAIIRYAVFYHIWTVQSEGGGGESRKGGGGSWRKRGTQFLGGTGAKVEQQSKGRAEDEIVWNFRHEGTLLPALFHSRNFCSYHLVCFCKIFISYLRLNAYQLTRVNTKPFWNG